MSIIITVSYTHLDVYKRQVVTYEVYIHDTAISQASKCLVPPKNVIGLVSVNYFNLLNISVG